MEAPIRRETSLWALSCNEPSRLWCELSDMLRVWRPIVLLARESLRVWAICMVGLGRGCLRKFLGTLEGKPPHWADMLYMQV